MIKWYYDTTTILGNVNHQRSKEILVAQKVDNTEIQKLLMMLVEFL